MVIHVRLVVSYCHLFFRGVTDAINQLLDQVLTSAPGQKECDIAIRNIEGLAHVLDNPVEPVNEASFFECLDTAAEKSQDMTKAVQHLSDSLKKEDADGVTNAVGVAADSVCQLTESTAQVGSYNRTLTLEWLHSQIFDECNLHRTKVKWFNLLNVLFQIRNQ